MSSCLRMGAGIHTAKKGLGCTLVSYSNGNRKGSHWPSGQAPGSTSCPQGQLFFFISSYIYILLSTMLTNTWFRSCTGWVAILASVTSCTGHFDILDLPWLTHHGSKTGLKPMQVFIMLVVLVAFAENLPQFEEDLSENTTFLLYLYSLHDGSQRI